MATNERFVFGEQIWFDANNPGVLHDAMRADLDKAREAIDRRPSLKRHLRECQTCQDIITEAGGATRGPAATGTHKRYKVRINKDQMLTLLGLPNTFEIIRMFADNDPNIVTVEVTGDHLPATPIDMPAPAVPFDPLATLPARVTPTTAS